MCLVCCVLFMFSILFCAFWSCWLLWGTSTCGTSTCGTSKCGTSKCGTSHIGTSKCCTSYCWRFCYGTSNCGTSFCIPLIFVLCMISDVSVPIPKKPPKKPISKKKPRKKLGKRKVRDEDQQQTSVHKVKVFTTTKPIRGLEDKCPFFFNVSWDAEEKRWFILCKQKGCQSHVGHMRMSKTLSRDELWIFPKKSLSCRETWLQVARHWLCRRGSS